MPLIARMFMQWCPLPACLWSTAGTAACDVWEVDGDPEILIHGQQADLYGLAMNPRYPHVYATVCESERVTIWSAVTHKVRYRHVCMAKPVYLIQPRHSSPCHVPFNGVRLPYCKKANNFMFKLDILVY